MDAQQEQYQSDLESLGDAISQLQRSERQAMVASARMENVALFEQLGKISREIDTFERMVQQHRLDRAS